MSLVGGTGPFGPHRAGRFNFDPPDHVVFVEPVPRRVSARLDGATVIDTLAALLVCESGERTHYAFPAVDVRVESRPERHSDGYVVVPWDAMDEWYEEDERVEVHPRDPYHRIDVFATSRRVTATCNGVVLGDSTETRALFETSLPARYYFPVEHVRTDLLEVSTTVTRCAYKGTARHWSARLGTGVGAEVVTDVAWTYSGNVRPEAEAIRDRIAFYPDRIELVVDGTGQG